MTSRRFTICRLHAITWLVLVCSLIVLGLAQWRGPGRIYHAPAYNTWHGWPAVLVVYRERQAAARYTPMISKIPPPSPKPRYTWHPQGIAINLVLGSVLLAAVAYLVETGIRKTTCWYQFRLSTLITLSIAVTVSIVLIKNYGESFGITIGDWKRLLMPWDDTVDWERFRIEMMMAKWARPNWHLPNYLIILLSLGIFCTVYAAIDFVLGFTWRTLGRRRPDSR